MLPSPDALLRLLPAAMEDFDMGRIHALIALAHADGVRMSGKSWELDAMIRLLGCVMVATGIPGLTDDKGLDDGVAACDLLWRMGARLPPERMLRALQNCLSDANPDRDSARLVRVAVGLAGALEPDREEQPAAWRSLLVSRPAVAAFLLDQASPVSAEARAAPRARM